MFGSNSIIGYFKVFKCMLNNSIKIDRKEESESKQILKKPELLSKDILTNIFSYLELKNLPPCCCVNKNWKQIGENDRYWKAIFSKELSIELSVNMNIKQFLNQNTFMFSSIKMLEKVNDYIFLNRNIGGKILVFYAANEKMSISISFTPIHITPKKKFRYPKAEIEKIFGD